MIQITFYTDPLCCWSWASGPSIQRLKAELGEDLQLRYCMGGLIPDWKSYSDPVNAVTRPIQMGPVWRHAAVTCGMPIDERLWVLDPPSSSYPACIAVKAAGLQLADFEEAYLHLLWKHCMIEGKNIAKQEELITVAMQLSKENPSFDPEAFSFDLCNGKGLAAFRSDLEEVQLKRIPRFPSMLVKKDNADPILIQGFRTYEHLYGVFKTDEQKLCED